MHRREIGVYDMPSCPRCEADGVLVITAVRQGTYDLAEMYPHLGLTSPHVAGVCDIGYRCTACEHEWGFEIMTDEAIAQGIAALLGARHEGL